MNVHPSSKQFSRSSPSAVDIEVEQAVLAHCLIDETKIDQLRDRSGPHDFAEGIHQRIADILISLRNEGRSPSLFAVAQPLADTRVTDEMNARKYVGNLIVGVRQDALAPWTDALETLIEGARRRDLGSIGSTLVAGTAQYSLSVRDLVENTVQNLDEVASSLRKTKVHRYNASQAAEAAINRACGSAPDWPTTGLTDYDRLIGGFPRGQVTIIAGRPGMGKSAVATSCVLRGARAGHATAFFSLEMTDEQLGARLLTDLAYTQHDPIHYDHILRGNLDDERTLYRLKQARELLSDLPLEIEEQRGLTVSEIAARSRKIANEFDRDGRRLETIVVDHLLLVKPGGRYSGTHEREVAETTEGLAALGQELDVSMVLLCQLNRGVEGRDNKRPTMPDLRASGAIEEIASVITFVYREAYYLSRTSFDNQELEGKRKYRLEQVRNDIQLITAKNRNGREDTITAYCDIGANAIRDKAFGGRG